MNRLRPLVILLLVIIVAVIAWRWLGASPKREVLSGYIVGDNLNLAAPVSGTVQSVSVADGQRVTPGQLLFSIAPATLEAQGEQAAATVSANQTQISTAEANLRQAEAEVAANRAATERARSDLARLAGDCDYVVCTLKDAVKIGPKWPADARPLWYVSLSVIVESGGAAIDEIISRLRSKEAL